MPCVVYWLYDSTCTIPELTGYVGISERWGQRLGRHRKRFGNDVKWKWLFVGTRDECLIEEHRLRPTWGIGWNWLGGGRAGMAGAPKSVEHRAKMSRAAKKRYKDPSERLKTIQAVKKAFETIDRTGKKNGHFGKRLTLEQRQNISLGRTGKGIGNQNWRKRKAVLAEAANSSTGKGE
jgi:hypothetical protein